MSATLDVNMMSNSEIERSEGTDRQTDREEIPFTFICGAAAQAGHNLLILEVSISHTTMHHSRQDYSRRVINPSQRPLPDNTQYSQQTNIKASGGIRTRNPSKQEAADPRLRTRGHRDRHNSYSCPYFMYDDQRVQFLERDSTVPTLVVLSPLGHMDISEVRKFQNHFWECDHFGYLHCTHRNPTAHYIQN